MLMYHFHAGAGSEKLLKFKKWFWSILEKMPMAQRQDLVSLNSHVNFDVFFCGLISGCLSRSFLHHLFDLLTWKIQNSII